MCGSTIKWSRALLASALFAALSWSSAAVAGNLGSDSVVKIYVTSQRENYAMPWQPGPQASGSGTGFIIRNRRLLTNAHMVADARFLEVQKSGDARRYRATVVYVAHDCDLAMLAVDDPSFFQDTKPMRLADEMPTLNDEVVVLGYPLGGDRLSVTKGVVSRLEYAGYAHSGIDQHLVLQVDAAINPGNSGGPVTFKGRVVGLAFQGLAWADNIGYAIPLPVIRHFLADVADGRYHGYPEFGVAVLGLRNAALRRELGLPASLSGGVVATFIDEFGAARGRLRDQDVLLEIDGYPLAEDGTISLGDETVPFSELLERKQWGDTVHVKLWRDGAEQSIDVPLDNPFDPFTYRNQYDQRSPYLMVGGLVFAPLSQELLRTQDRNSALPNVQQLFYTVESVKMKNLNAGRDEFVVLIERLAHPVNAYLEDAMYGIVDTVNGVTIRSLREFRDALRHPEGAYHQIRFVGIDDVLVLDATEATAAEPSILKTYNLPAASYLEDAP